VHCTGNQYFSAVQVQYPGWDSTSVCVQHGSVLGFQMTTIGYGDVTAATYPEMIVVIFMEGLGAVLFAMMVGSITESLAQVGAPYLTQVGYTMSCSLHYAGVCKRLHELKTINCRTWRTICKSLTRGTKASAFGPGNFTSTALKYWFHVQCTVLKY
jgi:Ion channel